MSLDLKVDFLSENLPQRSANEELAHQSRWCTFYSSFPTLAFGNCLDEPYGGPTRRVSQKKRTGTLFPSRTSQSLLG